MKVSLVGLNNCGKTSICSVAFGQKKAEDTQSLNPTIFYEVRHYPFLGFQIGIFDFGGQEDHRKEFLEKPEIFAGTDILIPVVDLHDPKNFEKAKKYFKEILDIFNQSNKKPKIFLLLHKCDTKNYQKELIDANIRQARNIFLDLFVEFDFNFIFTSIFEQNDLRSIFRDILLSSHANLKINIQKMEKDLQEIKTSIIITDILGNILIHNVQNIGSGFILRKDLRSFLNSCNNIREKIFTSDSANFKGKNDDGKEIEIYIFKYIISVIIMKSRDLDVNSHDKVAILLNNVRLLADLIVSANFN